ncbi:hypothetical protein NDU88_005179 [Pleurodeles waltl]|uniref:Uncharacterized protein n=1 Tax=Pleurodeles waltl TaxID=8319 RepID=A0AAV7PES4_PLEWA|nr:hypothetical protein NDU88_005179 [Pleurodeles waltl]
MRSVRVSYDALASACRPRPIATKWRPRRGELPASVFRNDGQGPCIAEVAHLARSVGRERIEGVPVRVHPAEET